MNFKEIEVLLEKFYEGETTPSEEQQLRDFFLGEVIPPHLAEHASLFRYYEESGKEELRDPEFENRFLDAINETPVIPMSSRRKNYLFLTGIAAAAILLAGLVFTLRNDIFLQSNKKTTDPRIAYQQVRNALSMVSSNLNSGLDQAQKLEDFQFGLNEFQKLKSFQKGINQVTKFSKFYQYQTIIINPGDQTHP